uniref:DIDO1 n=1 Tax=Mesocestoides corti TaxID=53468 RepID=A0A5K3G274_MESCO
KSLLQLAAQPPEGLDAGDRVGGTTPVTSQRDLRDQPVMEEPEGEAETASEAKSDSETESDNEKQPQQQPPQPTQLSPISESPE